MLRNMFLVCMTALSMQLGAVSGWAQDQQQNLTAEIDRQATHIEKKIIEWRRDIHAHPELSNRETRTAALVAEHLRKLGLEVKTGIAHTGVVGLLRGGKPGRVVALRADMDALPVTERVDVPFASKVRTTYNGRDVGVMHACGHDTHVAILMGVAEMLSNMKADLPGTVKFIFQPAEEGAPLGEKGGASLMVAQGVLVDPRPDAIYGLHVTSRFHSGQIGYRAEGSMASSDSFAITIQGRQTHGAVPWRGVDPITTAAQVILGLQTISSRQLDLTSSPAVISVGMIEGGVRSNIIPDDVRMLGTIRTLDPEMRPVMHKRIRHTAETIAAAAGATAKVEIHLGNPVTYNDPDLVSATLPTLQRVAGPKNVLQATRVTGAEDFAFYQEVIPGMFYYVGVTPPDTPLDEAAPNHSPLFYVDEDALILGARSLAGVAVDFLTAE